MISGILALAALLLRLRTQLLKPVTQLRNWATRLHSGNYGARIPDDMQGGFAQLAHDLNDLGDELHSLNLEMAATPEMVAIALDVKPDYITLVPERREEVTTEGGLNVKAQCDRLGKFVHQLQGAGIPVSLFVDAETEQIQSAARTGAKFVELHTGTYANAKNDEELKRELASLTGSGALAIELGLRLNAGHGLTYWNTRAVAQIAGMEELNIGHSIISRAVLVGLERAIREMKALINP